MRKFFLLIVIIGFVSCKNEHTNKSKVSLAEGKIAAMIPQKLSIHFTEDVYDRLDEFLQPAFYVKLDNTPLLAGIKDIHIVRDRIYVWDAMSRIVCYNMNGKMLFQIDAKGQAPGEYVAINAFTVNENLRELVIYDNARLSLLFYSSENGSFLRSKKLEKPSLTEMACWQGYFFYNNRFHRNYQEDHSLHYSLLCSRDGFNMDRRYFAHDEAEEAYVFSPSRHTFHDNYSKLYYCRNFDNIVYQLHEDSVIPRFEIDLPNPLPLSAIEQKRQEVELIKSGYSLGLTDIYESNDLLYFRFIKGGFFMSCLYDLKNDREICCSKSVKYQSSSFFDVVNGVYKDFFYSILSPDYIAYTLSKSKGNHPDIFDNFDEQNDNPYIGFYKVLMSDK